MSARDSIATAASVVETVHCTAFFRQSSKPGDGFVRLDRLNPDTSGFGYMAVWQVCVLLPTDIAAAEKWVEAHCTALLAALDDQGVILGAQPAQLVLSTGTVPAFIVTLTREQE